MGDILRIREFEDAVDVIEDDSFYLVGSELIKIIENCELFKENGKIIEDKDTTSGKISTKIKIGDIEYGFRGEDDSTGHIYGQGGASGSYYFLQKNKEDVLVSMHFSSYSTSSDDWFDDVGKHIKKAYLLKEDKLARAVFEEIRKRRIIKYFWLSKKGSSTKENPAHILKPTHLRNITMHCYMGFCGEVAGGYWYSNPVGIGTLQDTIKDDRSICEECNRKYKSFLDIFNIEIGEINNFINELNTKNTKKSKYQTTYTNLRIKKRVGILSIGEHIEYINGGGDWVDRQDSYYFRLNEFCKIAESLRLENKVDIDYTGFHSYYSSQHDQSYPEKDYRRDSLQEGRTRAGLELEPENKLLKINNLQFFPTGDKINWEPCYVERTWHSKEIEKTILSQFF